MGGEGGESRGSPLPMSLAGLDFSSHTLVLSLVLIVAVTIMMINQVAKIMGVPHEFPSPPPSPICRGVEPQGGGRPPSSIPRGVHLWGGSAADGTENRAPGGYLPLFLSRATIKLFWIKSGGVSCGLSETGFKQHTERGPFKHTIVHRQFST